MLIRETTREYDRAEREAAVRDRLEHPNLSLIERIALVGLVLLAGGWSAGGLYVLVMWGRS